MTGGTVVGVICQGQGARQGAKTSCQAVQPSGACHGELDPFRLPFRLPLSNTRGIYKPPHQFPAFSFTRQKEQWAPPLLIQHACCWIFGPPGLHDTSLQQVLWSCSTIGSSLSRTRYVRSFVWRLRAVSVYFLLAEAPCLARRPEFTKSPVLH